MFWVQRWETESNRDCSTVQKACCWKPLSIVENFKGHCCYHEEGDRNKFDSLCIFLHHRLKLTESLCRGFRGRPHVCEWVCICLLLCLACCSADLKLFGGKRIDNHNNIISASMGIRTSFSLKIKISMTFCSIIAVNPSLGSNTRPQDLTSNRRRRPPHCKQRFHGMRHQCKEHVRNQNMRLIVACDDNILQRLSTF